MIIYATNTEVATEYRNIRMSAILSFFLYYITNLLGGSGPNFNTSFIKFKASKKCAKVN